MEVILFVSLCVCACVRACVCVCACVCVRVFKKKIIFRLTGVSFGWGPF